MEFSFRDKNLSELDSIQVILDSAHSVSELWLTEWTSHKYKVTWFNLLIRTNYFIFEFTNMWVAVYTKWPGIKHRFCYDFIYKSVVMIYLWVCKYELTV